jgi:hypothetical protein
MRWQKSAACRHCYAEALTAEASESAMSGHGFAEQGSPEQHGPARSNFWKIGFHRRSVGKAPD